MNRLTYILIIILLFGCQSESENYDHWGGVSPDFISAVDISNYPKILSYSPTFYDENNNEINFICLLYTSPSPRDLYRSRMPSSA